MREEQEKTAKRKAREAAKGAERVGRGRRERRWAGDSRREKKLGDGRAKTVDEDADWGSPGDDVHVARRLSGMWWRAAGVVHERAGTRWPLVVVVGSRASKSSLAEEARGEAAMDPRLDDSCGERNVPQSSTAAIALGLPPHGVSGSTRPRRLWQPFGKVAAFAAGKRGGEMRVAGGERKERRLEKRK